jgi:MFS family permease
MNYTNLLGIKNREVFYGYFVVGAAVLIMTLAWGANRTFGVFLPPMLHEFGWTRGQISGAFTLCMIIMGAMSVAAGRLTDRFGPKVVLIGCSLFLGFGYFLSSQVSTVWQFYVYYGVITGIGMSGTVTPLMSLVARWFEKNRALLTGIVTAGPALGITIMPPLFSALIIACGWRISYVVLSGMTLVLIGSGAMILRRDPNQMGLSPYGADEGNVNSLDLQNDGFSLGAAFRTKQLWLLGIIIFCDFFLMNVFSVHIVIHAEDLGVPAKAAASLLSVAAGVSIIARIIVGSIADRIGCRIMLMICFVTAVVAFTLLLVARDLWMLYLFSAIFGFGLWSSGGLIAPMTAEQFGLRSHGAIFGLVCFAGSTGGAVGPVLIGFIFDATASYYMGFLICLSLCLIALMAVIALVPTKVR